MQVLLQVWTCFVNMVFVGYFLDFLVYKYENCLARGSIRCIIIRHLSNYRHGLTLFVSNIKKERNIYTDLCVLRWSYTWHCRDHGEGSKRLSVTDVSIANPWTQHGPCNHSNHRLLTSAVVVQLVLCMLYDTNVRVMFHVYNWWTIINNVNSLTVYVISL